ncbi:MAG: lytic transglycosylase domain-containing protein [Eubacteriales bacterium]|nr:lytic transglycosylase domain-containing protein [Eubacteriales bacterium]
MAVMSSLAVMMTACLIIGAIYDRKMSRFEEQSEKFDARMAAVEERREASGQNAMLESARAYMETQGQQDEPDRYAIFDTMPADWGGENDGFVYHAIPEEYERTGGYFPEKMQCYTYILCKLYGVEYSVVVALIEQESGYTFDKVGDDGNSIGYMQVYESAHTDRMERLNCTNLMNPYQNVKVGIDFLAELIEKYGTVQDALAAYNYGERGAREHLWNNGIYVYSYNEGIMSRARELEEEWGIEKTD